nr:MAG TPA: hypothetical protein [Caudoviricetes sp.]
MIDKKIQLTFNSTVNKRVKVRSNCELYSHDKNNNEFELTINNYTLTNETITVLFKFVKSIKYWETQGKIEDNKIKFKFDTSLITDNERVNCYIILKNEEKESDIYSFSFDVKMSEYDLKDNLPTKERYFANSVVVDKLDVLTKGVLAEELEKAKSTFALKTDLSEFVRTSDITDVVRTAILNDYQLKSEMPNVAEIVNNTVDSKGFLTTHQSLVDYAKKSELPIDYVSNAKLEELKTQLTIDTSNFATKQELQAISGSQQIVDTSNLVTKDELNSKNYLTEHQSLENYVTKNELDNKHYLTAHQDISNLATKQELQEVSNRQPTVDTSNLATKQELEQVRNNQPTVDTSNLATKEELKKAFLDEKGEPKYATMDLLSNVSRSTLATYAGDNKSIEEYFNEVTTGLSEDAKTIYNGEIYKDLTDTKVYIKGSFVNFSTIMHTLAEIFPANYNYMDERQVVNILTNKNYQDYIKGGTVDTNDFATKRELNSLNSDLQTLRTQTYTKFEMPFKSTGSNRVEEYLRNTGEYGRHENFGRLYTDNYDNRIVVTGGHKTAKLETLLYTVGSSLPDSYEPDFEFSEGDNIKFITNKNISNYLPASTGNSGNTTELDNRLKVLEAKNWEIHGRGMPNGVVTAPVGTTYVDEAVTNGALKWIKKSGNGNTGWEVLIGDTGWKVLPSVSKLGNSFVKVRRVNNVVSYQFGGLSWGWFGIVRRGGAGYQVQPSDRERNCFILGLSGIPTGYRSESSLIGGIYNDKGTPYGTWYLGGAGDGNMLRFQFTDPVPTDRDIGDIRVSSISYLTSEPWPQN